MKEDKIIYLDNASTTRPYDDVVSLFQDISRNNFANADSIHKLGVYSSSLLGKAKEAILKEFKLKDFKVIFTSGASESNNLAIKGAAFKYISRGKHLITTEIEHPSVLECFKQLEELFGFKVTYLKVNEKGQINLLDLENAIDNQTTLVSIMAVNNEIGSIMPIKEIAKIVHKFPKAILHVDATQSICKENINFNDVDMFSFSAHKFHGLKGSGALILKNKISLVSVNSGGDQEYGFRAGTSDLGSALCLKEALSKSLINQNKYRNYILNLNKTLRNLLSCEDISFNSDENCSPFIVNFSLLNKKASVVVEALSNQNIFVSSVSACHSKREEASYVVKALGKTSNEASNTIRVSFSYENTLEDVTIFCETFKKIIRSVK